MINNKQINVWRGDSPPPTFYHVWIQETKMLLYDGAEWIVFIDDKTTVTRINELITLVDQLETDVTALGNNTVNNKKIKTNPVLNGDDILLNKTGTYVTSVSPISTSIINLDTLLTTQIIE